MKPPAVSVTMKPLSVDVPTAAAVLGVGSSAMWGFINSGVLPVVKFPGRHEGEASRRVLIAVADLEIFVEQHRITTEATR